MKQMTRLEDVQAVLKVFTEKYPDISTREISDHLLTINAILAADYVRSEADQKKVAENIGLELAKNIQQFIEEYSK